MVLVGHWLKIVVVFVAKVANEILYVAEDQINADTR